MQITKSSWNPLRVRGTDLPLNLTVMVKVLALVVLLVNHVKILPDPWLPFIPGLDQIPPLLFQRTLQSAFLLSAVAIIFNRRVRLASLILGATMLLAVVSSKAYYGNNKTFCGLMFVLAGLYKPGGPNFIRWQLALTYFGAGLNKALDADWHSGVFFENWAVHRLRQPWYIALDSVLPRLMLAKMMCWTTIVTELATVPCLLIPSLEYWAVLANIFFQSSLLLFTGTTFTLFFYSMTAASFAFFAWPQLPVSVLYDDRWALSRRIKAFFTAWDFDGIFQWTPDPSRGVEDARPALRVVTSGHAISGFRALRMLLLLNPITWLVIASAIALGDLFGEAALYRRVIVSLSLILLMPPLAWIADTLTGGHKLTMTPCRRASE
ncbi:MAG: hypothetical protein JWN34_1321 [Bryobacterales bacterium]|nr:hypothetical protein [Bryobacterales bacterium]